MLELASVVDTKALLEMLWTASLAGIGATFVFAVALYGATRAVDLGRAGRPLEATVVGVVGALAFAVVLAVIAYGIVVMVQK